MTMENLICTGSGALIMWVILTVASAIRRALNRRAHRQATRHINHKCGTILHRA